MSAHEYARREQSSERIERIAALVAVRVHRGAGWKDAVRAVALELDISPAAVAYCVRELARELRDPYLESVGA